MREEQRDSNRGATQLSRNFYRTQKEKDGVLDFFSFARRSRANAEKNYSTCLERCISRLGEDFELYRLALLILDSQRLIVFRIHQLHFDLAKLSIASCVARSVREHVLAAKNLTDAAIDLGNSP